jgi:virulence factor
MSRLRVAVIGAGNIAQQHLRVLTQHPECEVAVLCDRNPAVLAETADRFQIGQRVASAEVVVRRDDLDAAFVLVTHTSTVNVASLFLEAGMPTLLEKPPGLFSTDTARLAELHERRGGIAMVGLNRRFYANHLAVRERLVDYGPLCTMTVEAHEDLTRMSAHRFSPEERPLLRRRRPYANSIHVLDLIRYFGGEVDEVYSSQDCFENDFPDSYSAVLRFASGARGRVALDLIGPGRHRFELRGVGATFTSEPGLGATVLTTRGSGQPLETRLAPDEDDERYKAGFWKQASAFLAGVRAGRQPPFPAASPADALRTMRLIDQICQLAPA